MDTARNSPPGQLLNGSDSPDTINEQDTTSNEESPLSTNSGIPSTKTTPTDVIESTAKNVPPEGIEPLESNDGRSKQVPVDDTTGTEEWMSVHRKKKPSVTKVNSTVHAATCTRTIHVHAATCTCSDMVPRVRGEWCQ